VALGGRRFIADRLRPQRWRTKRLRKPFALRRRKPLVDSGVAYLGSSEIGYSPRVRGLRGAGSRSALPLRFSVIFEYGGLIP